MLNSARLHHGRSHVSDSQNTWQWDTSTLLSYTLIAPPSLFCDLFFFFWSIFIRIKVNHSFVHGFPMLSYSTKHYIETQTILKTKNFDKNRATLKKQDKMHRSCMFLKDFFWVGDVCISSVFALYKIWRESLPISISGLDCQDFRIAALSRFKRSTMHACTTYQPTR